MGLAGRSASSRWRNLRRLASARTRAVRRPAGHRALSSSLRRYSRRSHPLLDFGSPPESSQDEADRLPGLLSRGSLARSARSMTRIHFTRAFTLVPLRSVLGFPPPLDGFLSVSPRSRVRLSTAPGATHPSGFLPSRGFPPRGSRTASRRPQPSCRFREPAAGFRVWHPRRVRWPRAPIWSPLPRSPHGLRPLQGSPSRHGGVTPSPLVLRDGGLNVASPAALQGVSRGGPDRSLSRSADPPGVCPPRAVAGC